MPQQTPVATNGATPPPVTTPTFSPKFLITVRAAVEAVLAERSPEAVAPPELTTEALVAMLGNESVLNTLDACIRDYLDGHFSDHTGSLVEDRDLVTWNNAHDLANEHWFSEHVHDDVRSIVDDYDFSGIVERGIDYDFASRIQDGTQDLDAAVGELAQDVRALQAADGLTDEDNERLTGLENAITALAAGIAPLTAFLDTLRATAEMATLAVPSEPEPQAGVVLDMAIDVVDPELERLLAEEEEILERQRHEDVRADFTVSATDNLAPRGTAGYVMANVNEYISSRNWTDEQRLQVAWLDTDRNADGNLAVWLPIGPGHDDGAAPFGDSFWQNEDAALAFIGRTMVDYNMADRRLFRGRP